MINLLNEKFGRLTILNIELINKRKIANCICECGNYHNVRLDIIKSGSSKSCGCLRLESVRKSLIKYSYNKQLLTSNTNEMYYILGIMFSDGNLKYKRCTFKITLKAEDKYLLEDISYIIKGDKKLRYNKVNNSYEFEGTDKTIYNQFLSHGLTAKKSKTLIIPQHLKSNTHFWRGMFDGDGWITINENNKISIGICGTMDVCNKFKSFCENYITINNNVHIIKNKENYGQFIISGNNSLIILDELYKNKSLFLKRKYEKYINYLKSDSDKLKLK